MAARADDRFPGLAPIGDEGLRRFSRSIAELPGLRA